MIWDKHCDQYLEAMELAKKSLSKEDFESWTSWGWEFWIAEYFLIDYFRDLIESKPEIVPDFANMPDQEIQWFLEALEDERRKWFALCLISQAKHLPEVLFPALIKAAVYENDASLVEYFVGVASRFGCCKVAAALFDYAEHATDARHEYALSAVYWVLAFQIEEESSGMLALLRDIAVNSEYSDSVRDQARRYYEVAIQCGGPVTPNQSESP